LDRISWDAWFAAVSQVIENMTIPLIEIIFPLTI